MEAKLNGIGEGELHTLAWRGMPVWIMKRTAAEIAELGRHDQLLADPDSRVAQQPDYCRNPTRSIKPEWFICVGICTHLGCSPTLLLRGSNEAALVEQNWPGGFFCPCHGSKFDLAGRVFKNVPAPANLMIPLHRYLSNTRILIGEDKT